MPIQYLSGCSAGTDKSAIPSKMPGLIDCPDANAMSLPKHPLELLSPARDISIAKEAILQGADAVYIGGLGFGARHNAGQCGQQCGRGGLYHPARFAQDH
jgi:hypothetical protein